MTDRLSTTRRIFMARIAAGGTALVALQGHAQPAKVDEKDAQASALGYVADTTKADGKKYPKHANDQKCSGCQLFGGKAGDASGTCSLFQGKHVMANGWCSAWVKKAG